MAIKLYTISGAPRGWRVLIGLTLKDLEYNIHYLQGSKQEHKQTEFLKINPRGMIPVIEHNGTIIHDSIAILAWLDREYPKKPLFGETNDEAKNIWQITMEGCDHLRNATNKLLRPILVENVNLPNSNSEAMNTLQAASEKMHAECAYLEKLLARNLFLAGENPSAAEAIVFPEIRLVKRAIERKPDLMGAIGFDHFDEHYPMLFAWRERIEALPNMNKTLPYHWNE
ncbi:glutathione S-transferase family protein [Arenicella xantha]|uniref:Maleylpyruvate isomerase n=1 Tax=Arenicella xantha TaxID=644221 RepID=A0A395JPU7_9GAMM|nr:glutathione S-transferase family protein [Arenicella xantha]RBP53680.1 maleylpyruvate isomerase [Arenicella xantha]